MTRGTTVRLELALFCYAIFLAKYFAVDEVALWCIAATYFGSAYILGGQANG